MNLNFIPITVRLCCSHNRTANGTRYRYIGDEPLENAGSAGAGNAGANASTSAAAKTRSRPNSEYVLYARGEPVAMNSDDGVNYFGTDILGSVRSVTDKYGAVVANYEYDAFGTPYLSNLENDVGFGYTGKIFDSARLSAVADSGEIFANAKTRKTCASIVILKQPKQCTVYND